MSRIMSPKHKMTCCVCGNYAGYYEQHWNQDDGYGICHRCVVWLKNDKGYTDDKIKDLYGIAGINYEK
jgi:hypothetical protein